MLQTGGIKIRDIKELQDGDAGCSKKYTRTPLKKRKHLKSADTCKITKTKESDDIVSDSNVATTPNATIKIAKKRQLKSALKRTPVNQKGIDSYFASCPKSYDIKLPKEELLTSFAKSGTTKTKTRGSRNTRAQNSKKSPARTNARRKRLLTDSTEPSMENMSDTSYMKSHKNQKNMECIIIDSDSEEENKIKEEICGSNGVVVINEIASTSKVNQTADKTGCKVSLANSSAITGSSLSFGLRTSKTSYEKSNSSAKSSKASDIVSRRKAKPCPPYKIIENTTFAVDAFQFGYIDNVTHYFLTHFHADHYIGLTKSFSMPVFVSPITARLLRAFIPVQEQYIHELDLNQPCVINGIEITALDANHCPGSVMFVFKFLDTGKCILHTGDFRACHDMESEPIFWNNKINTIYLDTTYISDKYAFCTQYESIEKAQDLINKFLAKHCGKRVLYICGSYIIGKEKFWSSLAAAYSMKVWTEGNRYKALKAMNNDHFNCLLVEDPSDANMHILPMGKLTYLELVEYFKLYEDQYDVLFAIRPSGWEKGTKPRFSSKINLIGVEYSEHSSYAEMQRFVKFLKPDHVISTVPTGKDLMKTSKVPANWYKYDKLKSSSNYQPSIDSFMGKTPQKRSTVRLPNADRGGVEYFVSPLKPTTPQNKAEIYNKIKTVKTISLNSSHPDFHENTEELCRDIAPEQLQNGCNKSKINTLADSISNSSEDFEKFDLTIKRNALHKVKKENCNKNVLSQSKPKRNNKPKTPNSNNGQVIRVNSEELFETPKNHIKMKSKSQSENSNFHISCDNEVNNLQTSIPEPSNLNEQNSNSRCSQQTKRRSQRKNSSKSTTKTNQTDESFKSFPPKKISTSAKNTVTSTPLELELPISQKRMTRSKTNSTKTSKSFHTEQNHEVEFESKKVLKTEKTCIQTPVNYRSQLNSTIDLLKYQENPILKSTTNSSIDQISNDGVLFNHSTIIKNTLTKSSTASGDNSSNGFNELPTKSSSSKRSALNHNSTPFKRTKAQKNTHTYLNSILEQSENLHSLNLSQLAGVVVETVNKNNPDNSKDHIPLDLLSDADDDWM